MSKICISFFLIASFSFLSNIAIGQTQAEELKKLKQENEYLRKSLDIRQAKLKQESSDEISFELLTCKAHKAQKGIHLEFQIVNKATDKTIQFSPDAYSRAIDLQGNTYKPDNIQIGAEKYASTIHNEVPLKLMFSFKEIPEGTTMLKLVTLKYFLPDNSGGQKELQFKDVPISWQ